MARAATSNPVTGRSGETNERLCREPGCEQERLPGRRFCLWHPKLDLDRTGRKTSSRRPRPRGEDPWSQSRSAFERHPGSLVER